MQATNPRIPHRRLLLAFATIPSIDCIVDQVNNVFQVGIGPLSLLQVERGYLLLVFVAVSLWFLLKEPAGLQRIPLPAVAAFFLLAMVMTKEVITRNTLPMPSFTAYSQMMYWLLFWITISIVCKEPDQAEIILWGLGIGATLTAVSVMAGLAFGGLNFYEDDAVRSSAGWFDTSKYITGVLVCGGVTLLYLGRKRRGWLHPLLAGLCFVACIETYARAGSVALGAVLLWFLFWYSLVGERKQKWFLSRFLLLVLATVMIAPLVVKTDTLFARWRDLDDPDKAGSGRASFWKYAADTYIGGTPAQQSLGFGFQSMSDMLFLTTGSDIKHCHNDLLDLALVGGVPGVAWLLLFIGAFGMRAYRCSLSSAEGAASFAILVAYVLHGQFTGQLWSPDAMSYNTLSLACLSVLGRPRDVSTISLSPQAPKRNMPGLRIPDLQL